MRFYTLYFILWTLFCTSSLSAQDTNAAQNEPITLGKDDLVFSLSSSRIEITSSFTGQDVVLFGSLPHLDVENQGGSSPYSVVINIKGPKENVVIRKKERSFGLWLNLDEQKITIPSFAAILSDRPLEHIDRKSVV